MPSLTVELLKVLLLFSASCVTGKRVARGKKNGRVGHFFFSRFSVASRATNQLAKPGLLKVYPLSSLPLASYQSPVIVVFAIERFWEAENFHSSNFYWTG